MSSRFKKRPSQAMGYFFSLVCLSGCQGVEKSIASSSGHGVPTPNRCRDEREEALSEAASLGQPNVFYQPPGSQKDVLDYFLRKVRMAFMIAAGLGGQPGIWALTGKTFLTPFST